MKKFVVVAYDIENNKRRREATKLLEAVGRRVNKSVFECFLSEVKLEKLKESIDKQVVRDDSILYYTLCKSCIERVDRKGATGLQTETVKVF